MYSVPNGGFLTAPIDRRSVGMWIKPDDLNGQETLYEEGNLARGIGMRLNNNLLEVGVINLYSFTPINFDLFVLQAPFPNDGGWHHAAYTYDLGEFKLYIDGVAVDSVSTGIGSFALPSDSDGGFGGNFGTSVFTAIDYTIPEILAVGFNAKEDFYEGRMDFTTYHNIALSEDQLSDLIAVSYTHLTLPTKA